MQFCACNEEHHRTKNAESRRPEPRICGKEADSIVLVPERETFKQMTVTMRDVARHRFVLERPRKARRVPMCTSCRLKEEAHQREERRP